MSQLEPAQKKPAKRSSKTNQTICDRVRNLTLDLAGLTTTLEDAEIIPVPLVEVDDSENRPLRKAVQDLMDAAFQFLGKCEEEPNASLIDEDENDGDDRHPGESWEDAMELAAALRIKRCGFSYDQEWFTNPSIATTGFIFEKIKSKLKGVDANFQEFPYSNEILSTLPQPLHGFLKTRKDKFGCQHVSQFRADIERCGRELVLAWLNKDANFFSELTRKVTIAFGHRRAKVSDKRLIKDITIEERLIRVAIDLWYEKRQNPSRELVFKTLAGEGVHIRGKDQSGYFKRCKLSFLTSERKPGRPRKHAIDSASQAEVRTPLKNAKLVRSKRLNKNDDGFSRPPVLESSSTK